VARGGGRRGGGPAALLKLIEGAVAGEVVPVCLIVGEEALLAERAAFALRDAALGEGPPGFNDDLFHGSAQLDAQAVLNTARTMPMMATRRFVRVRQVEATNAATQKALAEAFEEDLRDCCLVITGRKLDGRSALVTKAKKAKAYFEASPLSGPALNAFVEAEARSAGHAIDRRALAALVDTVGEDLASLIDAVERLGLFVGEGQKIDVSAVEACVTRVAVDSIWKLVDAVSDRDLTKALTGTASLLRDREPALRILAMVARQLRIVARMKGALAEGLRDADAAKAAGAPPFKARALEKAARAFDDAGLQHAFQVLAETDLALKGSKRPDERVLEEAIVELCQGAPRARERIPRKVRSYR
jgi:DNA polymerase-3 subunit delta